MSHQIVHLRVEEQSLGHFLEQRFDAVFHVLIRVCAISNHKQPDDGGPMSAMVLYIFEVSDDGITGTQFRAHLGRLQLPLLLLISQLLDEVAEIREPARVSIQFSV